ncbi:putative methionyl-tRNA synthetase [Hordeum vulgare]|nr:putative methionyl-tRNA synthetase [Hordeum vulgare]
MPKTACRREEKSNARWSALMKTQNIKLNLIRSNVAMKKRNTDLAFLVGADMSTMDEGVVPRGARSHFKLDARAGGDHDSNTNNDAQPGHRNHANDGRGKDKF